MEKNIEGLKREGIPHIVLAPKGIKDIAEDIRRTGEAAGIGERAERVAERFERRLEEIRRNVPERPAQAPALLGMVAKTGFHSRQAQLAERRERNS